MARQKDLVKVREDLGAVTTATSSAIYNMSACQTISCIVNADVPAAKTFDSGESAVETFTFDTKANTDPGDYIVVYDTEGNAWAAAADVTGSDPEPTGAVWVSIPSARKVQVDLQAATTAANVAAAFETALNGLADVPFVAADSTADLAVTQDIRGPVTAAETYNEDDSGTGSISVAVTNAGVASEVDVDADSVTIPDHGFLTGVKIQLSSTGTLPTGVTTSTDYWVIKVDDNTIQFAASRALALAGTALPLTSQGSDAAVNTATPVAISGASIKLQKSNDRVNWVDEGSATNITVDAIIALEKVDPCAEYYKAFIAISDGTVQPVLNWLGKGIDG